MLGLGLLVVVCIEVICYYNTGSKGKIGIGVGISGLCINS